MYKIAIDAMGGDNAPAAIVAGVEQARDSMPNVIFQLFGDQAQIKPLVKNTAQLEFIQADETIMMGEEPVRAIRKKKQSSMVLAAQAVKQGQAQALFSAGNTGALLASGIFIVGRIKGVDRPALMTTLPAFEGPHEAFVMMDVGANAENKPAHLYQYGVLGSFYAQEILRYAKPRVGLLNNGTEPDKGDALHKSAHALLTEGHQAGYINFVGNVESRDLLRGPADVVVADGFSGNATLKAIEGTAQTLLHLLKDTMLNHGLKEKVGGLLLKPALKQLASRLDYSQYGGAVVVGVQAPVVKTHGSANAGEVKNTLIQIDQMLEADLTGHITRFVAEHAGELNGQAAANQGEER
ncbi:phosphate acyltransferase PlsX [Weissella halotolerans]|uniref:Phosphate acyltransferase n=1 Tax=Weissella halotolerans DSM 20190 TaxID=1123500 RepID=A0A0R2G2D5_9LACO|nr:phosphate acyltransferase PlsX [Weissella halotolerans]KRN31719.1 fatty acid phospholipid synthesis protein PlsX [Weissella halotolerans DSM 20190]